MNTMNKQAQTNDEVIDLLWKEMRETASNSEPAPKEKGQFKVIPDGNYNARVEILPENVSTPDSPNLGRTKYTIKLVIVEGDLKGKMAYVNRVTVPHNLANPPSEEDTKAFAKWSADLKAYLKKTDEILEKCGVSYTGTDKNRYVKEIADNNRRNPIVNFTMRGGNAYINNLVKKEPAQNSDELFTIPDGNDLPL